MDSLIDEFFDECEELLQIYDAELSRLRDGNPTDDTVNAIFRSVHSIKGGAGAFNLTQLVEFSHDLENLLDSLRSGSSDLGERELAVLEKSGDFLAVLVEEKGCIEDAQEASLAQLRENIRDICPTPSEEDVSEFDFAGAALDLDIGADLPEFDAPALPPVLADIAGQEDGGNAISRVGFAISREFLQLGIEPLLLFRALLPLGHYRVEFVCETLPAFSKILKFEGTIVWILHFDNPVKTCEVFNAFSFFDAENCVFFPELDEQKKKPVRQDRKRNPTGKNLEFQGKR